MNTNQRAFGAIVGVASIIGLTVGAIVAECKKHKAEVKLADREILLGLKSIESVLMRARIRSLEEELEKSKSCCQDEGES